MQKNKEIILALDSSSEPLLLALEAEGKTFTAKKSGLKQEEYLFSSLKKLLAKAGCSLNEVNKFFFIKGPGRFTGIRISITLASMLAELTGAEILSASVFDILRFGALRDSSYKKWLKQNPEGVMAVIVHAFREEYFAAVYDKEQQPAWLSYEDLLAMLEKQNKPLFITGWGKDRKPLSEAFPQKHAYAPAKINKVQPSAMIAYFKAAPALPKAEVLEPLYLKPARFELNNK